jgi:RNA polymerase sigma factor (sigma-70 family)
VGLNYGDVFADWEIAIAKKAVRRFQANYPWLRGLDFDDLLQECLIHWYLNRARYRESKGVSIKTYMARVLSTQLQLILRQELYDKRKASHLAESLEKPLGKGELTLADIIPADEGTTETGMRIDIESALRVLTPLQREICNLLKQDYPVKRIAEMLGKPRSTIRDEIKRIKELFSQKGLEDY